MDYPAPSINWAVIEITVCHAVGVENTGIVSHEQKPDFDPCTMCRDGNIVVLPTGEMYRLCVPNKWKSYECAARQLVALKKPAAHVELRQSAKSTQRR